MPASASPASFTAPKASDGAPLDADVLVAGAGIVGMVLAIGLAKRGLDVVLAGHIETRFPGRTIALLSGSVAFLDDIGLWRDLEPLSEPLRVMRIVDDTGSLFRVAPVSFRAEEVGQDWFGRNILNQDVIEVLANLTHGEPRLAMRSEHVSAFDFASDHVLARCEDGRKIRARLVVACDGRRSLARQAAGVTVKSWAYPQTAITAILRHEQPHHGVSTEFHTRQGPFTLVPLPASAEAPHRSSLVWMMDPERAVHLSAVTPRRLAADIERQSRMILGRVAVEGPTGAFPIMGLISDRMTAPRLALAGEAAHAFPPIGAQGLNLGLRDVAALVDMLSAAVRCGRDPGDAALLGRYEKARHGDVAMRTMGVDRLNRSLLSGFPGMDLLRGAGLAALAHIGPLRRMAMRAGLGPSA